MVAGAYNGFDPVRGHPDRHRRLFRRSPIILRHILALRIFTDNWRNSFVSSEPIADSADTAGVDCPMRSWVALSGLACSFDEPDRRIASVVNGVHVLKICPSSLYTCGACICALPLSRAPKVKIVGILAITGRARAIMLGRRAR